MADLVLHHLTQQRLMEFEAAPSHALLLIGPAGIGKQSIAHTLISNLMEIPQSKVGEHQYVRVINAGKDKSISIEKVRGLENFLSRRVPGSGRRVVLIEDAQLLGVEAQNALLKTLEEPPENTILLLTVANEQSLLPTIKSRVQALSIMRPDKSSLIEFFSAKGEDSVSIARAYAMSGGLPGLMTTILDGQTDHPLVQAASIARQIAQATTFERISMVDGLSKSREQSLEVLVMLQQMARVSLRAGNSADIWQRVLKGSHKAIGELQQNGQPKLVLTDLMLSI